VEALQEVVASFDTRRGSAAALLRMRDIVDGIEKVSSS